MRHLRSIAGLSLIELMVTIAIIGIALGMATLSFHSWQVKNKIESQTRELFTDLSETRTNAFTQKRVYGIVFQPTSYVLKSYSSESEAASSGTVVLTKSLKYGLTNAGADITDTAVVFDTSGFTNNVNTIFVGPATEPAALNCLKISKSRENMGKINGSKCVFQ